MAKTTTAKRTSKKSADEARRENAKSRGFEERIKGQLTALGVPVLYEEREIPFVQPAKKRKYTPDFELPNGIIIETKGRFKTEDRQKHLLVKQQHPDLDIRFVFSDPNNRISKKSKTTYAAWCERHGFQYAKAEIPEDWINEEGP